MKGSLDYTGAIQAFDDYFTQESLYHIKYNYSESEIGIRHPAGPIGFMCRDQGQADMYAGRSRLILTTDGYIVSNSRNYVVDSDKITLRVKDIRDLQIRNRRINKKIFGGDKILKVRNSTDFSNGLWILSNFRVDPETGIPIEGFKPVTNVLEETLLFEEVPAEEYPTVTKLKAGLITSFLGI